jgi:hypothetical protein
MAARAGVEPAWNEMKAFASDALSIRSL